MARLTAKRITYEHFKGLRHFVLDLHGQSASVFGDNGTYKSTCLDGFLWCLFGRDGRGRADFEVKTLTPENQPIHHLEHSVELVLDADGDELSLKRTYREIWTKRRGGATQEFTGHETQFWIDSVPCQKREYEARVAAIIDAKLFQLLTDPGAFNDDKLLPWEKRRKVLLELSGGLTDAEVIASDKALSKLPDILGKRSLEDHRKVISAKRKEINGELEKIPVRIAEVHRGLPEAGGDRKATEAELTRLREQRSAKAGEQVRIQAGGEVAQKQRRITEIAGEILTIEQRLRASADQAAQQERAKLATVNGDIDAERRVINRLQGEINEGALETERLAAKLETLRAEFRRIAAQVPPEITQDENCPACSQPIPAEKLQEARDKALAEFNADKSAKLEQNTTEGKRAKARLDEVAEANGTRMSDLIHAENALATLQTQADEIQARIDALRRDAPDITEDLGYRKLAAEKATLELDISGLRSGNAEALNKSAAELGTLDAKIAMVEAVIGRLDSREKGLLRIAELEAEEKKLAAEFERLEAELALCEQFTTAQAKLLEERVNGKFRYARFKLFSRQINGGIDPCCVTLYGGVPWTDLNTGGRVQVGLDIIRTLQVHHGFTAPVWVDGAESVTSLPEMDCQVISLIVSKLDKTLRIEREEATKQLTLEAV